MFHLLALWQGLPRSSCYTGRTFSLQFVSLLLDFGLGTTVLSPLNLNSFLRLLFLDILATPTQSRPQAFRMHFLLYHSRYLQKGTVWTTPSPIIPQLIILPPVTAICGHYFPPPLPTQALQGRDKVLPSSYPQQLPKCLINSRNSVCLLNFAISNSLHFCLLWSINISPF